MRNTWLAGSVVLLAAACSSRGADEDPAETATLTADLFPFAERTARFDVGRGPPRTLRVAVRGEDVAELSFEGGQGGPRRLRATRTSGAVFLSGGPGRGTEILRLGAEPGDDWESGFEQIVFDGWERVEVPAGSFDAARITTTSGPDQLPRTETWWFAKGEGLVRLKSDHGGIFSEEMQLLPR